ncbi:MAG TPA: hypothetical protein VJ867_03165 [Gemmatimonadaceae bacterium]|nr:hypothetical protein [Gemmatimonadaceae bacterium]
MSEHRPFFGLPVIGIALVIAVAFFVVRSRTSKPDVPLPVSATVDHFAPGLALGSTIKEANTHLQDPQWVERVGYVGGVADPDRRFVQARLYPDLATRQKPAGDVSARVEQVEFVSTNSDALGKMMIDLAIVFHNNAPKEGCITSVGEDGPPQRRVQYWTTRNDLGGVALLTDWDTRPNQQPGQVMWSMMAWAGPFKPADQLHAQFESRPCFDSTSTAVTAAADYSAEAVEALNVAFRDSVWGSGAQVRQAADDRATVAVAPLTADACAAPGRTGPTKLQTTTLFTVDLPDDFELKNAERAEQDAERFGYATYEFRGGDNSRLTISMHRQYDDKGHPTGIHSGWTGLVASECTIPTTDDSVHVDIANASVRGADFVVHGFFYKDLPTRALVFEAHARSPERQEQLLYSLRSLSISPRWGRKRGD